MNAIGKRTTITRLAKARIDHRLLHNFQGMVGISSKQNGCFADRLPTKNGSFLMWTHRRNQECALRGCYRLIDILTVSELLIRGQQLNTLSCFSSGLSLTFRTRIAVASPSAANIVLDITTQACLQEMLRYTAHPPSLPMPQHDSFPRLLVHVPLTLSLLEKTRASLDQLRERLSDGANDGLKLGWREIA